MEWKPKEIIVNQKVKDDPAAKKILQACQDVPVTYVSNGKANSVTNSSAILNQANGSILEKYIAGKQVLYISPAHDVVDVFNMSDDRILCPHFERLKLASNACPFQCEWCYLRGTYRAVFPFATANVQYESIKEKIKKRLQNSRTPVMFNSGELADSLAMDHLTGAGQEFIPWFGKTTHGYLFMLTKSTNVDHLLDLVHNGHTIIAWSINNAEVSKRFEIGAPSFEKRLEAAQKVQKAGYPLRLRLDPILPIPKWEKAYAETIRKIFAAVNPDRITLGTLRFEEAFYRMRKSFIGSEDLMSFMNKLKPMFTPKLIAGSKRLKSGKYSLGESYRVKIFRFVIDQIRLYSDCPIALCKESADVWDYLMLDRSQCRCVCQYDYADLRTPDEQAFNIENLI